MDSKGCKELVRVTRWFRLRMRTESPGLVLRKRRLFLTYLMILLATWPDKPVYTSARALCPCQCPSSSSCKIPLPSASKTHRDDLCRMTDRLLIVYDGAARYTGMRSMLLLWYGRVEIHVSRYSDLKHALPSTRTSMRHERRHDNKSMPTRKESLVTIMECRSRLPFPFSPT
jgi:hypothetical protein